MDAGPGTLPVHPQVMGFVSGQQRAESPTTVHPAACLLPTLLLSTVAIERLGQCPRVHSLVILSYFKSPLSF